MNTLFSSYYSFGTNIYTFGTMQNKFFTDSQPFLSIYTDMLFGFINNTISLSFVSKY